MRSAFRTGRLLADPEFLSTVPRPAMVAAIVRHATSPPTDGQAVRTDHEHEGRGFYLETDADRQQTAIGFGSVGCLT